jgi:hypothetical protein
MERRARKGISFAVRANGLMALLGGALVKSVPCAKSRSDDYGNLCDARNVERIIQIRRPNARFVIRQ